MSAAAASQWVIDTRELPRRPGSMRPWQVSLAAPAGWSVPTAEVPEGSTVVVDARLESVLDGILLSGRADMVMTAECSRCLENISELLSVTFQELFTYDDGPSRGRRYRAEPADVGDDEEAEGVRALDGDLLDSEPVLRDCVILDLPLAPLCRQDCQGLCEVCGIRLDDDPEHRHPSSDPRWATLAGLYDASGTPTTQDTESKGE